MHRKRKKMGIGRTPGKGSNCNTPGAYAFNKYLDRKKTLEQTIKSDKKEIIELETRVKHLDNIIEEMYKYSPNGEGYISTKKDFENKVNNIK